GFPVRPVRLPIESLTEAALSVGHNFAVRESYDAARRIAPFVEAQGVSVPSLGLAAALAADRVAPAGVRLDNNVLHIGTRLMPLSGGEVLLNFHGPHETAGGG